MDKISTLLKKSLEFGNAGGLPVITGYTVITGSVTTDN